jgi:hypothetical protein
LTLALIAATVRPSRTNRSGAIERGANCVSAFTADPGARVLWCLRRRTSDVRCVLYDASRPVEVRILQDRDLVLKEVFAEEAAAMEWAREYGTRLRQQGWRDSPEDCSPSSAA